MKLCSTGVDLKGVIISPRRGSSGLLTKAQGGASMEDIITKKCSGCGEIRQIVEFSRDRSTRDGLCSRCKKCNGENA